jgi:hypothetical protein
MFDSTKVGVRVGQRVSRKIKCCDIRGKGELGGYKAWTWQQRRPGV